MPTKKNTSLINSVKTDQKYIYWPNLIPGILIQRYKRFLADIKLESGEIVTAHCANSGSMKECSEPGRPVFLTYHDNPKRKLKYTWELIDMQGGLIGVNTFWPNKLVALAITSGAVEELTGYDTLAQEVKVGEHSRLDLLLTNARQQSCYIEVKNCTMVTNGVAAFPDAVTTRGQKHLVELQHLVKPSVRCVMFYLIQRTDAKVFRPADEIDPDYGNELRKAVKNGIEILAYDVTIDRTRIGVNRRLPVRL